MWGQARAQSRLHGVALASFHPHVAFDDAPIGDVANFTSWAPYPTVQVARRQP